MDSAAIAAGVADFQSAGAAFPFARAGGLTLLRATDGARVELASMWRGAPPPAAPAPTTTLLVFGRNLL